MRLIENYTSIPEVTVQLFGRTYPDVCLVEDDEGIRWLLSSAAIEIHAPTWARAVAAGAAGILVPGGPLLDQNGMPQRHRAITTERFAEEREERPPNYLIPKEAWSFFDHIPSYPEVYDARPGALVVATAQKLSGFVHLHTHSEYSPLDGLSKIPEIVNEVTRHGQQAVALTDHGYCSGHPQLQKVANKAGIKPIFGIEAYFQDDRKLRSNPENTKEQNHAIRFGYYHLILLAMNERGLHNLWAMSTESFRDGFYDKKPRMDWDTLRRHSEGVIAASACLRGPMSAPILNDDEDLARRNLSRLLEIFGDRFYLEIQPNALAEQEKVNKALVMMAKDYGVPLVATVDSHYPTKDDHPAHEAWVALQTNSDVNDEGDLFAVNLDLYVQSEEEARRGLTYLGKDVVDESIANTVAIAERCTASIGSKPAAPIYSKKGGTDQDAKRLLELCVVNWKKTTGRGGDQDEYMIRFEREFDLIRRKKFCGYFLMVADYCRYAKESGILVGPGRGSGAGSLVAYLCDITEVDPIAAELPFERFMTEGRTSPPDFDCVAGTTEFHRDGPGDRTVGGLYALLHGRPDARPGECEVCGEMMESIKRGYKGNLSVWLCVPCYKKRHHLRSKGLPSILGRNVLGRLSNQPLIDVLYKGVRDTIRITVSDGRFIESTPEHRHLTLSGWREAGDIRPGDLIVLMDDRGRRASHTDNLRADAKACLVERAGGACERCFEKAPEGESWLGKFEVAHLDYSTKNIDNMLFLCVGCHRRMDSQLGTPVVFRPATRVENIGEQPVYDMVMGHDDHSWVANGFVTHNCDFPASKKGVMLKYLRDKYGEQYVISIGTHLKLKSKGIIKDLGRSMMSVLTAKERSAHEEAVQRYNAHWGASSTAEALRAKETEIHNDLAAFSKIVTEAEAGTAGLGLSWDDLWAQFGEDLQPYRNKYPELFSMADHLVGRMKTYGKHAAGAVISTDQSLTGWLPLSAGEDAEQMVSQFDMVALEDMGLVKFDILTIRTLDTIQMAVDLIHERREQDVEIYDWKEEYRDPIVWERIAAAETLGLFQIETKSGTRLCQRMGPLTLSELCDMVTIVRPGPMRAGLTETYLRRRAGEEPVTFPDPRLEQVLGSTYGCLIYQEQIMQTCSLLAGYTMGEADDIRSILGKKKVEKIGPAGQEFVSRAVEWGGMQRKDAEHIWEQMAEFSKYSFGKAHAYSYAMITYWTAWLKFHYPVEFFTACLSTIDQDRIPEFVKEVRRSGYTVLPPDVNTSGKGFKAEPLAVRYGLDSIKGIGEKAVDDLVEGQIYTTLEYFEEYSGRKGSKINAGVVMLLAKVGALDSLEVHRAGLVARLEAQKSGEDTRCVWKDDSRTYTVSVTRLADETDDDYKKREAAERGLLPPNFCTFDWSTEEPPVNPRTQKKMPLKPLPKKCTRACRQYTAPAPMRASSVPDYTDAEIRTIEHDLLGVFLSSSPFDTLDPVDRQQTLAGAEALREGGSGRYMVSAIVMGARQTKTRVSQEEMAFLTLDTEVDTVEVAVFPKTWAQMKDSLTTGRLCYAVVKKDDRGISLSEIAMI